jgi:hypothetical protein
VITERCGCPRSGLFIDRQRSIFSSNGLGSASVVTIGLFITAGECALIRRSMEDALAGGRECQNYRESLLVRSAHAQREPTWRCSMIRLTLLSLVTIPSMALATPVLAQTVIQEPGAYAFYRFTGDLGIGSTPSQRRVEAVVGRGTSDDSLSLAPRFRLSAVGKETTTRPWSGPVGHRKPRPADVPASTSASQYVR